MSSSRSSTSQAINQDDNRRVIGEGGVSAENSTVNVLDGGAIGSAFQFAGASGGQAYGFANQALGFARQQGGQAFGLAGQAMDQVSASHARVLDFGADALTAAVGASDRARTQAFDFGADSLSGALGFGDAQNARVLDFGADSLSGALGFGDAQNARVLDFGADALSAAFAFGKTANTQAQDAMSATANLVKDAYADAKGRGALTDKMIMVAIAAMALVAFMAVKK